MSDTLIRLADTLVTGFDTIEMFYFLVDSCRDLLEVQEAGLMLIDPGGRLQVVAATSENTRLFEILQIQNQEGPCLEALSSGEAFNSGPLAGEEAARRWPRVAHEALGLGFTSITALPMRLRHEVLGALNLFFANGRVPLERDVAVAQAFADMGSIAILQDKASHDSLRIIGQLQGALDSRVIIEQAKGRLAQMSGLDTDRAFTALRNYARANNLRLTDVAQNLVDGRIDPSQVASGA